MKQHCTFYQMCKGGNDRLVYSPIFKRKVPMCEKCAELYPVDDVLVPAPPKQGGKKAWTESGS